MRSLKLFPCLVAIFSLTVGNIFVTTKISADTATLSGYVYDGSNQPLENQAVELSSSTTSYIVNTDSNGFYSISAPEDDYIQISVKSTSNSLNQDIPEFYVIAVNGYTLDGNTTMDFHLPFKDVTIHVKDGFGNPVENTYVHPTNHNNIYPVATNLTVNSQLTNVMAYVHTANGVTDEFGNLNFWLLPTDGSGSYEFEAIPPLENEFAATWKSDITISTNETVEIELLPGLHITGYVYDRDGVPIPNQYVDLSSSKGQGFQTQTNEFGFYDLKALEDDYIQFGVKTFSGSPEYPIPAMYSIAFNEFDLTEDVVVDLTIPTKKIEVIVLDQNDMPIENVTILPQTGNGGNDPVSLALPGVNTSLTLPMVYISYYSGRQTDVDGETTFWLFPNNSVYFYNFLIFPPIESGFEPTTVENVVITNDDTIIIKLGEIDPVVLSPIADTFIKETNPNDNEGLSESLRIKGNEANRGLISFDQSEINNAIGEEENYTAKLRFTIVDNNDSWGPNGRAINLHKLTRSWVEGNGIIYSNTPVDRGTGQGATWNCAIDNNIANSVKNCNSLPNQWDMSTNVDDQTYVSDRTDGVIITNGLAGVIEFDVTQDVIDFVSGAKDNFGWMIKKPNENSSGIVRLGSRESSNPPQLVITFE